MAVDAPIRTTGHRFRCGRRLSAAVLNHCVSPRMRQISGAEPLTAPVIQWEVSQATIGVRLRRTGQSLAE